VTEPVQAQLWAETWADAAAIFDYKRIAKQMGKDAAQSSVLAQLASSAYAAGNFSFKAQKDMNTTKDLITKALSNTDPFLEHDGELYKKFNRIEIAPVYKTVTTREQLGLFRSETTEEELYTGVVIKFLYGEAVVKEKEMYLDITNGDTLNITGEIACVMRVSVDENE
jgi:hypothetical protein